MVGYICFDEREDAKIRPFFVVPLKTFANASARDLAPSQSASPQASEISSGIFFIFWLQVGEVFGTEVRDACCDIAHFIETDRLNNSCSDVKRWVF